MEPYLALPSTGDRATSKTVRHLGPLGSKCQSQVRNLQGLLGRNVMKGRGEEAGVGRESLGLSADLISSGLQSSLPIGGAPGWVGKARPEYPCRAPSRAVSQTKSRGGDYRWWSRRLSVSCTPYSGMGLCPTGRCKWHPSVASPNRPGTTLMFWFGLHFTEHVGMRSLEEQGPYLFLLSCLSC